MDDKHDPNASVPIGTFQASSDDGDLEIPIEIVSDDEIEERQLAIAMQSRDDAGDTGNLRARGETSGPLFEQAQGPRRQRVATLLGVPLPGVSVAGGGRGSGSDPVKATSREIAAAVDEALDERPTTIYGYKRESLADLESIVEAEMTELPSETTGEIVGVVGRSSDTGTYEIEVRELPDSRKSVPVLAPAQFVEARARDATGDQAKADARARDLVSSDRARDGQPTAPIASRADNPNDARRARVDSDALTPTTKTKKPISSLAPVEINRARQREREPAKRREPASAIGYALVAAMVLLGIGGWFLTAGGYRRGSDQAAQPTAAANVARPSDALASSKLAEMPAAPAPVAAPAPPPEQVEAATPTPTPAPAELGSARPRVAGKAVRKVAAPASVAQNNEIETPSRDDLLNGLDRVRSNVRACAEGRNGVAEVDLTIAANGIVTNALVGGDFGGTPQGSCIARAVRKARFPTFKQDRYRVLFPYVL